MDERAPSHWLRCLSRTSWTALAMACSVACSSHAPAAPSAAVTTQIVSVEGLVTDVLDQPVGRATVTVQGDPNASAVTVTDDQGNFAASLALTVDASVTVRVSAEGFEPAVQQFGIGPHPTAVVRTWVGLSALSPLDLSGTYRVALRADGSCSSLPDGVRTRVYRASIDAAPASRDRFVVALSGATFVARQDRFSATVTNDRVRFDVFPDYFPSDEWMFVVEELGLDRFLAFNGRATTSAPSTRATIDLPLSSIIYCPASPTMPYDRCPVDPMRCGAGVLSLTRE